MELYTPGHIVYIDSDKGIDVFYSTAVTLMCKYLCDMLAQILLITIKEWYG